MPILALWITILFKEVDVPLASDVGVSKKQRSQLLMILSPGLDRTAKTALAPVTYGAGLANKVHVLQYEGRQWLLSEQ